jgi:tetratricopeptide (TPR) repeat protein
MLERQLAKAEEEFIAGHLDVVADICGEMIATDPQCHQAYYLLGRTCVTLGKGEQALELIARAAEIKPDAAPYHTELGNVLAMEEQFEDAADAYRRATELAPDFIDPHVNLGAVLQLLGRYAEAVMIYRKSTELAPDAAMLVFNMAEAQRAMGQGKASIDAYRQAVVLEPSWAVLHAKLGDALADHGDTAEAVECCRRAVELAPEEADHHIGLARALLSAGAGRSALSTCDAYMASHPYHSGLLAFRALLLNETGSQPAAERLLGLETLVRCVDVAVPAAFGTIEAFNSALSEEVEQRFEPEYDPDRQVTRNGKQSTSLFFRPGPGVALLMERIDEAVRAYISDLPDDPNHPLIGHVPDRWRLSGWSVTLEPHGFQTAHIGVEGWLGGLYAVEPRNGIVEFGAPPENWSFSVAPPLKSFELARGQLMLFPSYVYRRLPATGVTRCYIAFEIVAEG